MNSYFLISKPPSVRLLFIVLVSQCVVSIPVRPKSPPVLAGVTAIAAVGGGICWYKYASTIKCLESKMKALHKRGSKKETQESRGATT